MTLTDDQAGYSTKEMVVASGLSFRQLDWYDHQWVLTPSLAQAKGSGSKRRYSDLDLRVACVLARLGELVGSDLTVFRAVATQLREAEQWPEALIVDRRNGACQVAPIDHLVDTPPAGVFVRLDDKANQ